MPAEEVAGFDDVLVGLETCDVFQGGHAHFAVLIFASPFHHQGMICMSRPFKAS